LEGELYTGGGTNKVFSLESRIATKTRKEGEGGKRFENEGGGGGFKLTKKLVTHTSTRGYASTQ